MQQEELRLEIITPDTSTQADVPLAASGVSAGFPSPAEDFLEPSIDLNRTLIRNAASTFFVRVSGDSMKDDRIDDGGNVVLKEKKKELPNTWLKCLRVVNDLELIDTGNNIEKWNFTTLDGNGYIFGEAEHHLLPRGLGKPMLALCQLLVCRNAWWEQLGWKPDCSYNSINLPETHYGGGTISDFGICGDKRIFIFPTSEVRDKFLDTFRDLIEEAKELLDTFDLTSLPFIISTDRKGIITGKYLSLVSGR